MAVPYTVTRSALRQKIARQVDDLFRMGTATAGGANTIADTNTLFETDDFYNGCRFYIYSGVGAAQSERLVTDFASSTAQATVRPNWATQPTTASLYEVHRLLRVSDYNDAIDEAVRQLQYDFLVSQVSTVSLTTDDFIYDLPASFAYVNRVSIIDTDLDEVYILNEGDEWHIKGGSYDDIEIARWVPVATGYTLKIEGQAVATLPTADTDSLSLDIEFLVHYGMAWCFAKLGGRNSPDQEYYRERADKELAIAEERRRSLPRRVQPGSIFAER